MAQKLKTIEFGDGSQLSVAIQDAKITFTLQARHLGKEIKFTSASVELTPEETLDLVNWIGDELVKELSDE